MNRVTKGLSNVFMYIGDAIVFNRDPAAHIASLRAFLFHFQQHQLGIAPFETCTGAPSIDFLGHINPPYGLRPNVTRSMTHLASQCL